MKVWTVGNSAKFKLGTQFTKNLEIQNIWNHSIDFKATSDELPNGHSYIILIVETVQSNQCTKHYSLGNQGNEVPHGCDGILLLPAF